MVKSISTCKQWETQNLLKRKKKKKKGLFSFAENTTINISERGMKFGGEERAEHNIQCDTLSESF